MGKQTNKTKPVFVKKKSSRLDLKRKIIISLVLALVISKIIVEFSSLTSFVDDEKKIFFFFFLLFGYLIYKDISNVEFKINLLKEIGLGLVIIPVGAIMGGFFSFLLSLLNFLIFGVNENIEIVEGIELLTVFFWIVPFILGSVINYRFSKRIWSSIFVGIMASSIEILFILGMFLVLFVIEGITGRSGSWPGLGH